MTAPVTRFDAERAVHVSIGAVSPLWPAYFVAASSGVALWWLSRWTALRAGLAPPASPPPPVEATKVVEAPVVAAATAETPKTLAPIPAPEPVKASAAPKTPATSPRPRAPAKRPAPKA
jgi:cytoskeletal protein RodZ